MKATQAGKLNRRLDIQQLPDFSDPATAKNTFNEQDLDDGFVTVATVWGSITPMGGRETFYAAQISPDSTHVIEIRYFPKLDEKMRFRYLDPKRNIYRYFNIENKNDIEERFRRMQVRCHEGPSKGV